MKTQIIRIEPHDDSISVKDKMGWSQTPRILLVWPAHGRILNRRLDLVFLKRHCSVLGAQLALVSKDNNVKYHAENLNIPIYPSIQKAESSHWRHSSRRKRLKGNQENILGFRKHLTKDPIVKPDLDYLRASAHPQPVPWLVHPISRLIIFSVGVLAVLSLGAILLPSAFIELSPETHYRSLTISVTAKANSENTLIAGSIPIHKVNIIVEGRGSTPSTDSIKTADEKARGEVIFSNLADHHLTVPKGTTISTLEDPPTRFFTLEEVQVEPKTESELIPIEAIQAGSIGNVMSNHILTIEGPLGLDMTVTNPIGTSKGADRVSPAPSQRDYQLIKENLIAELFETATSELSSTLETNDVLLEVDPANYNILESRYSPELIQPADHLQLTLRVEFTAYVAHGSELQSLGQSLSEANLTEGFYAISSSISIQQDNPPTMVEDGTYQWDMEVAWEERAIVNQSDVISSVLWHTPDESTNVLLAAFPIMNQVKITMIPEWWPRLPILPFRITVANSQP